MSSPALTSFGTALGLLELSSSSGSLPSELSSFLRNSLTQLQNLHAPFSSAASTSTAPKSTSLVTKSSPLSGGGDQQKVVEAISARFEVDKQLAQQAVDTLTQAGQAEDGLKEGDWDRVTAFVFEERMAVIGIVGTLLRTSESPNRSQSTKPSPARANTYFKFAVEDPSSPAYDLAVELVPQIISANTALSLLTSFASRTQQPLPSAIRASSPHSAFWTKQLIREQKALLEVLFLMLYSSLVPEGATLVPLLDTIRTTEWGQRQETLGYCDAESKQLLREIGDLLSILAIEAMNLEQAMESEYPIPAPDEDPLDADSLFDPATLSKVNEAIEQLVQADGQRSSPILIGWAFLLSRVTNSLTDRGVPEQYHALASAILRVETSSGPSGPRSSQPLFQLYAAHALSPTSALFPTLLGVLQSPLFGSPARAGAPATTLQDPNAVGYLSVLRAILTSLPLLIRLSFLTADQYAGLVNSFAALYAHPAAAILCSQFWQEQIQAATEMEGTQSAQAAGESALVDLARSRFPVQFGPFVSMVRALCAGASGLLASSTHGAGPTQDDEALARQCALAAFEYLGTLSGLTIIMPPSSPVAPLPYTVVETPEYAYMTTRPIPASPNLVVPVGITGKLVSPQGAKPVVVAWECEWSAWRLFADVLEHYALNGKPAPSPQTKDVFGGGAQEPSTTELPIEWDDALEQERDVTAIVEILRLCVSSDVSLGTQLVEHMSTGHEGEAAHLVQVLFKILERAMSPTASSHQHRTATTELVSSVLGLITALLPAFPDVVWTLLRGSTLLFPSNAGPTNGWKHNSTGHAVLEQEKVAGSYPVTLSLLSLVHALVLENQVTSQAVSGEFEQLKQGVLQRALRWVKDEVWPVHQAWRFAHLADKSELSKRVVELYQLVLEEAELAPLAAQGKFGPVAQVVVDALLGRATVAQLAPLLTTLAVGPEPITLLRKALRYADAQASEDLAQVSLALVRTLLRLRRRVQGTTSSLLEKLLLTPTSIGEGLSFLGMSTSSSTFGYAGRRPELLESVSKFVVAPMDPRSSVLAAEVITLLCIGSTEWQPRPPSLIGLLGGPDTAEKFVVETLEVAADEDALEQLRVAIWHLNAAIVETQPSLGLLLVTGKYHPFGVDSDLFGVADKDKIKVGEETPAEKAAQALAKSLAPAPIKPLERTALALAFEIVQSASASDSSTSSALLHAVLSFFDFTWQHLVDYGASLDSFRAEEATWDAFVRIALENAVHEPEDAAGVGAYCHQLLAKAHAVRIVALDIQASVARGAQALESSVASKALLAAFADRTRLTQAVTMAVWTSCAPELHQSLTQLIEATFPGVELDHLRFAPSTHPLDDARRYGVGYLYSLPMLGKKLEGFLSASAQDSMVDSQAVDEVVQQTAQLNLNFSLVEAQMSQTRAWRQLLEIVLPAVRKDAKAAASVLNVATVVAHTIAEEKRSGQVLATVQAERLLILLSMTQVLPALAAPEAKGDLVKLVSSVCAIYSSEALEPLESLARRTTPQFHRTLFQITYLAYRTLNHDKKDTYPAEQKAKLERATEAILKVMVTATRDLLVFARAGEDNEIAVDLELAMAVVAQLVRSDHLPPATIWIGHCQSVDLFRAAFECFVHMPALTTSGQQKPLYAQHVLDFCLAIAASHPRAAEQMALEGLVNALTNNALTATAEQGAIGVLGQDGAHSSMHQLWTSMLELVVCLVSALGEGTQFVELEVAGFVRLYQAQLTRAIRWHADEALSLPRLHEMQTTLALLHGIVVRRTPGPNTASVAATMAEHTLHLLQHIVYALLHPNHLATRLEPVSIQERLWFERDLPGAELADRPAVAAVSLALLRAARTIVESLVSYTGAFEVLVRDQGDWKKEGAIVVPSATVTAGEKASIGTLFDLASFCTDTLRQPPAAAAGKKPTTEQAPAQPASITPFEPTLLTAAARDVLEGTLLLSAAQLGLWQVAGEAQGQGRAAQALRKEVVELAGDLGSVLDKVSGLTGGEGARGGKGVRFEGKGVSEGLVRALKAFIGGREGE